MQRSNQWTKLVLASLIGCFAGFLLPHLSAAADRHPEPGAPAAIAADAPPTTECKCEMLRCESEDGMRQLSAPCSVKCREGMVAECQCGKCKHSGGLETPNSCHCKKE